MSNSNIFAFLFSFYCVFLRFSRQIMNSFTLMFCIPYFFIYIRVSLLSFIFSAFFNFLFAPRWIDQSCPVSCKFIGFESDCESWVAFSWNLKASQIITSEREQGKWADPELDDEGDNWVATFHHRFLNTHEAHTHTFWFWQQNMMSFYKIIT